MQAFEHDDETRRILQKALHGNVPTEPDPLVSSRSISRGTTIVGLMLEDLGDKPGRSQQPGRLLARFGQVAWGLVELAAPRSLGQILFQYWIALAYALALLMVLVGVLTGQGAVNRAGYLVLGITVVINIVVEKLRRWMVTKDLRQLKPVWLLVPVFLAILGGVSSSSRIYDYEARLVANGASPVSAGHRAGELKSPSDKQQVLGTAHTEDNVGIMKASLGWDALLIVCYSAFFCSLGWIIATQFDRPFRAFILVLVPAGVTAASDILENLQAWLAISDSKVWTLAPFETSDVKLWAAAFTAAVLVAQVIAVRLDRASAFTRSR